MQKFENGDEVEVKRYSISVISYAQNEIWCKAKYIGASDNTHVVRLLKSIGSIRLGLNKGTIIELKDNEIRPVQLICDEAREIIKKSILNRECIYFDVDVNMKNELRYFLIECGLEYNFDYDWKYENIVLCGETNEPLIVQHTYNQNYERASFKLDLKTGKVTECESEAIGGTVHEANLLGEISNLKSKLKQKDEELRIYKKEVNSLNEQVQEKDAELEQQEALLKSKDATISKQAEIITEQGDHVSQLFNKINSLEADLQHYKILQDSCKEKDVEIERLKGRFKSLKDLFEQETKNIIIG
jgi:hypothetical protein